MVREQKIEGGLQRNKLSFYFPSRGARMHTRQGGPAPSITPGPILPVLQGN